MVNLLGAFPYWLIEAKNDNSDLIAIIFSYIGKIGFNLLWKNGDVCLKIATATFSNREAMIILQ